MSECLCCHGMAFFFQAAAQFRIRETFLRRADARFLGIKRANAGVPASSSRGDGIRIVTFVTLRGFSC